MIRFDVNFKPCISETIRITSLPWYERNVSHLFTIYQLSATIMNGRRLAVQHGDKDEAFRVSCRKLCLPPNPPLAPGDHSRGITFEGPQGPLLISPSSRTFPNDKFSFYFPSI